jgi:hypothetical protein
VSTLDSDPEEWPDATIGGESAVGPAGPEWTSDDDRAVSLDDGDDSDAGPYDETNERVDAPDDPSLWEASEG